MSSPSKRNLYLSALTGTQTASLFGYSVGFIGGLIVLPSFLSHFNLSSLSPASLAAAQARIVTFWLFGALLGVPLGMPVCSRLGRRTCLMFSAVLYVAGVVVQVSGRGGIGGFEIGRFINGLGVGCGTLVGPMYISEISPASERAMLMSSYQTILQLSALAGFWGAYLSNNILPDSSPLQWQVPTAIQLVPGTILLLGSLVAPETPRFLAEKGRLGEAEEMLAWLRGVKDEEWRVSEEMKGIESAVLAVGRVRVGFWREVTTRSVRRRLGVGVGLMVAQNMVGLNALNYYAPVIFMSAGFTSVSASLFLTGVFGVVKLLSAIAFMFIFVKMKGNRFWLLLGSSLCGACMVILAYFVHNLPPHDQLDSAKLTLGGIISVLTVYVFAFSFSVSLGPISWNVCSEIFPLHINAKCCAITTCTQWLFQIVIAYITPHLLASIGWVTYLLYATFCLLTTVWVYFLVPETRNVALGKDMDALFTSDGDVRSGGDEEAVDMEEDADGETTLLLRREGSDAGVRGVMRRGSLGMYT
ncbi:general substrate transporter [Leptodontidium sp. MPI-SDFR-AT-0119]|nr:general substrate transporter [Leptodontidium sp. MPI-SDFR-AT-0119]